MPELRLPTGTVTLLFTDIEGSTKRWEHAPEAMSSALMTHDLIMRATIEEHRGVVFKTIGDAFCAAFADPADALLACVEAQRALAGENWGDVGAVRVRMALHTGDPEHRDRDYFGPPVNRVARLLATAAGEQIVVSSATADRLGGALPSGIDLMDLGAHRLKDLLQPERIFQVVAEGLPTQFPPIKSLDRQPHNLPAQPTPLIGRDRELADVRSFIESDRARIVTLTGPGGIGKTRLALQVAADVLDGFPDGAWYAGLAPITDASLVIPTIAGALGVRETGLESLEQAVVDYLRDKRLLLVVDNFEHVVDAAPIVGRLLGECRNVQVLATSRAVLRIYGEREFAVEPLPLPNLKRLPPVAELGELPSVELFVERAKAVRTAFELTQDNAPAVAGICVRLDGLPLAIELAAARVRVLSPDKLLERLTTRLDLLTGGSRDRDARQQTLRGAIAWSHDLLPASQQVLFRRLAVFADGASFDAIAEIADPDGSLDALDGVEGLVQQSLLRQQEDEDGELRFTMLETIREYATERLDQSPDAETVRQRHADYFLRLGETAEPHLTGPEQPRWLRLLETEHDNLRAALSVFERSRQPEPFGRLAAALWRFWFAHGHLTEGRGYLDAAVASWQTSEPVTTTHLTLLDAAGVLADTQGDLHRAYELYEREHNLAKVNDDQQSTARALLNLGTIAMIQCRYGEAHERYQLARDLFTELGHERGMAITLERLHHIARMQQDLDRAEQLASDCLAVYRRLGDAHSICFGTQNLAIVAFLKGEYDKAVRLNREVIELADALGDRGIEAYAKVNLARALPRLGSDDGAVHILEEALTVFEERGDKTGIAFAANSLGLAELKAGNVTAARDQFVRALRLGRELDDQDRVANCLESAAVFAVLSNEIETGAMLFGAADALRNAIGAPIQRPQQEEYAELLAEAHVRQDDRDFQAGWMLGSIMPTDQAVEEALAALG